MCDYAYIIKLIEIKLIRSNNHATMIRIYKCVLCSNLKSIAKK